MPAKQMITSIKALPGKEIAKCVTIKPRAGDHVMLNYVEFVPNGEVPLHSHHHEQLGLILEGELTMQIGHAGDVLATLPGAVLNGLPYGLLFAPFFALIGGLLGGLTGGLSSEILDERKLTLPNQGIRRSFRHSLLVGVVAGMIGGIVGGVFGGIVSQVHDPNVLWSLVLSYGLIIGPVVGLISGLRAGGMACIQHVILRWLLWKRESMPWHYPHFLDYSTERVLLRKVGGGYIFIHRLLLEYFASLEAPFSTKV